MYGTIARFRLKPGMEDRIETLAHEFEAAHVPGYVGEYVYRMDARPNEYCLVVIFESKEAYHANASNPAQDARYRKLRELLLEDPEWNDGEIVYHHSAK